MKKNPADNVTRFHVDLDAPHHSGMTMPTAAAFTERVDELTRKPRKGAKRVYWFVLLIGPNPLLITSKQPISAEDEDIARRMVSDWIGDKRNRRYRKAVTGC